MVLHRWFSIDRDEKTFLSRDITFTLGVILTTRSAQKILEGGKKKPEETESVLSKINELITLAVGKGRGPTAVTGHRYSEYLKGLENSGEAERRRKRPKDEIPVLVKKADEKHHVPKSAVVPVPITEEALKATYSLTAALDKAKNGSSKKLEWLV